MTNQSNRPGWLTILAQGVLLLIGALVVGASMAMAVALTLQQVGARP